MINFVLLANNDAENKKQKLPKIVVYLGKFIKIIYDQ